MGLHTLYIHARKYSCKQHILQISYNIMQVYIWTITCLSLMIGSTAGINTPVLQFTDVYQQLPKAHFLLHTHNNMCIYWL